MHQTLPPIIVTSQLYYNIKVKKEFVANFTIFYCILYGVQNCDHVLYSIFAPKMISEL